MGNMLVDKRDVEFILYEQFDVMMLTGYNAFSHLSRDEFDMIIEQAFRFAENEMQPANVDGDRIGARWDNGTVTLPESFHRPLKMFGEHGWVSVCEETELGGLMLPVVIFTACNEVFHAANTALNLYPSLAHGTATMIRNHGTEEQKSKYLQKILTYEWTGSMNITEPEAGSSLAHIKTRAEKIDDVRYRITGQKIFITGGEHDAHPNIVHPVLARIKGDPQGIKGISIFLVPKYHVNDDGSLGARNDVTCAGIEHKMGIRGSATCQMNFGDAGECIGEILGKPGQGIPIMFLIMNEERLNVGVQSVGLASGAYQSALRYATERRQGADISKKSGADEPVPIIRHPDVRRMLLMMKAYVEGLRALNYYSAMCIDRKNAEVDENRRKLFAGLTELLTPVCKAYSSLKGFEVCSNAMNIYGGYGYCMDYPVEQYLRDQKITALYEGTNAIHSIDLFARKMSMDNGAAFTALLDLIQETIDEAAGDPSLKGYAAAVAAAKGSLEKANAHMKGLMAEGKVAESFQDTLMLLEIVGDTILGWMFLWQAGIAEKKLASLMAENGIVSLEDRARFIQENRDAAFYSGKVSAARYFIMKILPMVESKTRFVMNEDRSFLDIEEVSFGAVV